jgi:hypothetical protein
VFLTTIKKMLLRNYIKLKEQEFYCEGVNLKYLFNKSNSDNLIVSFSGFSPGGARYNYIRGIGA